MTVGSATVARQPPPFHGVPLAAVETLALVVDEETANLVLAAFGGSLKLHIHIGALDEAAQVVMGSPKARLLLIDISGSAEPFGHLERIADVCPNGTGVVVLGDSTDQALQHELAALGVGFYLVKPIEPQQLREAAVAASGVDPANSRGVRHEMAATRTGYSGPPALKAVPLPEPAPGSDPISRRAMHSYAPTLAAPESFSHPSYSGPAATAATAEITPMPGIEPLPRNVDLLAFLSDSESASLVAALIAPFGGENRVVISNVDTATAYFAENASPKLLIVDIAGVEDPMGRIDALAHVCAPGTIVIVVGEANDVGLYRALKTVGVYEYMVKPLQPETVKASIMNAVTGGSEHAIDPTKPMIFVIGARGGVGASTLAISIAGEIANRSKKVCLLDLDLQYGSVALALDTQPGEGLRDVLESPERLDSMFLNSTAVKISDNLHILSAEENVGDAVAFQPEAIDRLLSELTRHFDAVIVDMPRHVVGGHWAAIGHAHKVLLVADLSLVGIRDTSRLLAAAKSAIDPLKVKLLLSGAGHDYGAKIDHKEFETALKRKIDFILPHDGKAVLAANQAARPVTHVASGSKLAETVRAIANELFRDAAGEDGKKRGRLAFWKKKKKK